MWASSQTCLPQVCSSACLLPRKCPRAWRAGAATAAGAPAATGLACSLVHCAPCRTHVSADLGASKTVGVVTNPASAPMEDVPRCAFS